MKRLHIYFEGRVQGVGFRFTVEHLSHVHEVTGFVRNLSDGRVEVVVEGEEQELERFLATICSSLLKRYISNYTRTWESASGEYKNFTIKF